MSDDIEQLLRLRTGDRLTERDCLAIERLVNQRRGLIRGNERRRSEAIKRRFMVRWHCELLAHLHPKAKKGTLVRIIKDQWAGLSIRQVYRDLEATTDQATIEWARREARQARKNIC